MRSNRTLFLIEVAIFTALALVLDILPIAFKVWPNGGSVSFAMIPVFIVAFRWGIKGGLLSGLLWGLLQIAFGASILTPLQGLIEYGFAFTLLGLAGIFAKPLQRALKDGKSNLAFMYVMLGVLIGTSFRFLAHFYAGIVFWGHFAPEGQKVWLYSFLYNGSYMLPSFVLCTVLVFFLFYKQPRTLLGAATS
ncbi:energy-coupled thiamine transporter ThiT [Ornithinibacillus gellani]|uniref:energy-coupled thiamine transporter ThiT n=1 Tax=Ornithinibacillus gellani TaxID=2293253 RepID=UPI000F4789D9|nr:energy-coupled thiamine transporter ThiT [Ornithinibacillus gellani]TQS75748.1 energy-coupled thiamine transporter ThiT [Ornithinibacillus gellani]